jgi:hypothetical protein
MSKTQEKKDINEHNMKAFCLRSEIDNVNRTYIISRKIGASDN